MFDPYYARHALLLPMEGANNSTTFTDYSSSPKTVTPSGDTRISTAQSKWGNGSGYFDGAGDWLTVAFSYAFNFGWSDFMLGGWLYPTALPASDKVLLEFRNSLGGTGWVLFIDSSNKLQGYDGGLFVASSVGLTLNAWNYVEMNKTGLNTWWSIGGSPCGFASTTKTNFPPATQCRFGIRNDGAFGYIGHAQDWFITPGVARPYGTFTPPTARWRPVTIGGTVVVSGNGGADQVVVRDVATRKIANTATPNPTTGVWSATVQEGEYDISYFAAGAKPVCHGSYTITA